MKKTLLAAALIAGFGIAAVAPQVAQAAANSITFTGKVLNSTCSATVNGSATGTVVLPDVAASAFTATGAYTASATGFSIALTGCPTTPSGVSVGAQFYSSSADTTTGNGTLSNTTGGTYATNVDVQLLNSAGSPITITTAAPSQYSNANVTDSTVLSSSTATLSYTAQYYATTTSVGPGLVSTTVNYVINYQ